ncbi:NUDIX hydrolase [Porticoccus sp. W117]|uniref:NUDIX hydrolase n=1 Tax=Porticoccus sp. W117 TaxID=3054777 RepID=UPI002598A5D9|nr:NUDIX hydrolase [Porticoccus sp. W117]MDM3870160.1 NUDIX hydrolase [Porticoccus sp. W117]
MRDFKPVPAIPSASLILLRDSADGLQVLVARRNPELRMAGNFWVFPGGALEEADVETAEKIDMADELLPFRLNALRETQEEIAIDIESADSLVYFSHWIAPDQMAMRFDTRFFAVAMPTGQQPQVDGSELVEHRWITPRDLVAKAHSGEFLLMFPTMMNAHRLMAFGSVDEVLADAARQTVEPVKPVLSFRDGKGVAHVPAEVGFGITEWEFTYPIKTV